MLHSFSKTSSSRLRVYFQTVNPCGEENQKFSGIVWSGWKWLFDGLNVNASTSWSFTYLQVYMRASSCAWTRQKYAPFEVWIITIVHELWLTLHYCFVLSNEWDPFNSPFQHLTGERESLTLTHGAAKNFRASFYRNFR